MSAVGPAAAKAVADLVATGTRAFPQLPKALQNHSAFPHSNSYGHCTEARGNSSHGGGARQVYSHAGASKVAHMGLSQPSDLLASACGIPTQPRCR